jgi:hypothetical protein
MHEVMKKHTRHTVSRAREVAAFGSGWNDCCDENGARRSAAERGDKKWAVFESCDICSTYLLTEECERVVYTRFFALIQMFCSQARPRPCPHPRPRRMCDPHRKVTHLAVRCVSPSCGHMCTVITLRGSSNGCVRSHKSHTKIWGMGPNQWPIHPTRTS